MQVCDGITAVCKECGIMAALWARMSVAAQLSGRWF